MTGGSTAQSVAIVAERGVDSGVGEADRGRAPGGRRRRAGRVVARRLVAARLRHAACRRSSRRSVCSGSASTTRDARARAARAAAGQGPAVGDHDHDARDVHVGYRIRLDRRPTTGRHVDVVAGGRRPRVDALDRAREGRVPQRHRRSRVGVRHVSRARGRACSSSPATTVTSPAPTSTLVVRAHAGRLPSCRRWSRAVYDGGQRSEDGARSAARRSRRSSTTRRCRAAVSTVDDLELAQGQVAAVLSLAIVGSGNVGHYGYGTGASAPLPPHPS